jgi:peptide/nickel transport system permease protein
MMSKLFSGDLISYDQREDVIARIIDGAPRTFALAIGAAVLWLIAGIALGLFSAVRAGGIRDRVVTVLALIGISTPVFLLGALASYYLGYKWGIVPDGGYVPISEGGLWEWFRHLWLPWVVLATLFVGVYSRIVRSNVLDTINDDYVRTARAKGISERRVIFRHVLRNSLIPVITLWGLDFGYVLGGGAILTEKVFSIQGVGGYFADSISRLDVPPVMAVVLFGAFFIVLLNTIVDIVYAVLDPRIRLS